MKLLILSKILVFFAFVSLAPQDSLRIVFSKASGSENYKKYISFFQGIYPQVIGIDAYGLGINDLDSILGNFDGLVLTGGPDVHPRYYNRPEDTIYCQIDPYRDSLEFKLLDIAFARKLPIFAICRGEQILNVYLGGSLYPDIEKFFSAPSRHRCSEVVEQCYHSVYVDTNSFFYKIIQNDSLLVNSFHHQAVEKLGRNLRAFAWSSDGLIEAFEWERMDLKPFFIAIQWHPERLELTDSISRKLVTRFIEEVKTRKSDIKIPK
ncbi:MAG: gamma-glutamyl-gamma-aminobutyrate hydrolase family protein [Candidatus Kapaibacteriales bacterium]